MSWRGAAQNPENTAPTPTGTDGQATSPSPPAPASTAYHTEHAQRESGVSAHPVDAYSLSNRPQSAGTTPHHPGSITAAPYFHLPPPPADAHLAHPGPAPPTQYNNHMQPQYPIFPAKETGYGHGYGYQPSPYVGPGAPIHDNGKIVGGPVAGVSVRYALMAIHTVLTIIVIALTGVYYLDIINISFLSAMALAFLIYIPAAFGLTVARRRNHFDHAGGEVAYLVIQQVGWLAIGITNILYLAFTDCEERDRIYSYDDGYYMWTYIYANVCQWSPVILGLSFAQMLLLMGWMIWIIVEVHRRSPADPNRGFQVSTAWLLRGWRA